MPLAGSGIDQAADSVVELSGTVRVKLVGADGAANKKNKNVKKFSNFSELVVGY